MKEKGFVTMESAFNRGLCLGMTTEGRVRPTVDTGDKNVRLYPEVIECEFVYYSFLKQIK